MIYLLIISTLGANSQEVERSSAGSDDNGPEGSLVINDLLPINLPISLSALKEISADSSNTT